MQRLRAHGRRVAGLAAAVALVSLWQFTAAGAAMADSYPADRESTFSAIVDQAFAFGVAGLNGGVCNGTTITGTGSTADAVSLGRVDKTSSAVGAQNLSVASNAGVGYSVYAKVDGPLADGKGNTIANIAPTNANPGAFTSPGTEGFGYTTDATLSGDVPNRFSAGGTKWAAVSLADAEVMHGATTAGTVNCIAYQITISSNTVGGYYGNNVTYTAVPTF